MYFGAILFAVFSFGQSAASIGGMFMMFSALFCVMASNMLTFGILANTVENFSQGKLETNFMPDFDDFSMWDDVVHPFFLSIAAYIQKRFGYEAAINEGFGFADFSRALAHPFKFKTSVYFGAILFAVFSFGQSAASIGGMFMMFSLLLF